MKAIVKVTMRGVAQDLEMSAAVLLQEVMCQLRCLTSSPMLTISRSEMSNGI
jgi:hypothetical protein